MSDRVHDEKTDIATVGECANVDVGLKKTDCCSRYYCDVSVNTDSNQLQVKIQNKKTKQRYEGSFTLDQLAECGFHPQQSLCNIEKTLKSAFGNDDALTVKMSIS